MNYTLKDHKRFVEDMELAGLKTQFYSGRNFFRGPAVVINDVQEALFSTRVKCQWDNMGKQWVVYPKVSDSSLKELGD